MSSVVLTLACPRRSWMVLMSNPFMSSHEACVCRSEWNTVSSGSPRSLTSDLKRLVTVLGRAMPPAGPKVTTSAAGPLRASHVSCHSRWRSSRASTAGASATLRTRLPLV